VESPTDTWRRFAIADSINPINNFDPLDCAPPDHEGAGECYTGKIDGQCIVHHTSRTGWRRGPPISPAICIQPCDDLVQPVAESFGRNANPDPDRKSEFRFPKGLVNRPHRATRR
jgi:hypothetical protein